MNLSSRSSGEGLGGAGGRNQKVLQEKILIKEKSCRLNHDSLIFLKISWYGTKATKIENKFATKWEILEIIYS